MPRRKNNFAVSWTSFQSRYKLWDGKKGWQNDCRSKWAEIKGDNTTLTTFYNKMLEDIENNEKKNFQHCGETLAKLFENFVYDGHATHAKYVAPTEN